jgi:TPR repeat protein
MADELESQIIKALNDFDYIKINDANDIKIVHNLFINKVIPETKFLSGTCLFYLGLYFGTINNINEAKKYYSMAIALKKSDAMTIMGTLSQHEGNNDEAKKYYLMAIELKNSDAMNYMGRLLDNEGDFNEAEKYYLMAIELGNTHAMNNMGYLLDEKGNLSEAKKYYLMAIELGNTHAMNNMGYLLQYKVNFNEAKKYYLMAIELKNAAAMNNMGSLLQIEENYNEAKKYFLMAIDLKNATAMNNMGLLLKKEKDFDGYEKYAILAMENGYGFIKSLQDHYIEKYTTSNNLELSGNFLKFITITYAKYNNELCSIFKQFAKLYVEGLELIDLHFNYSPGSKGAEEAKVDFISRMRKY